MSDDEYDRLFDDFAQVTGADWETILPAVPATYQSTGETHAAGQAVRRAEELPREVRPSPSSESDNYFGDDDEALDSSFLAAVDAIEHAATQPARAGPSRGERSQLTSHMNSSRIGSHSNRGFMYVYSRYMRIFSG
jgi:hypothetical protein